MNKTIKLSLLLSLFLGAFFISCNKDDGKGHAFDYINLEYYEHFTAEGSDIYFLLSTIETFPCSNFQLEVSVEKSSNHTDIRIQDLDVPDVCITSIGPATQQIVVGPVNDAAGGFTVWVNDKRHDFSVQINQELIAVNTGQLFENHLFFSSDSLLRIPQNTFWGYTLTGSMSKKPDFLEDLMEEFIKAGAKLITLSDGNYYYFTVKEGMVYFGHIKQEINTFYFQFDNSMTELVDIYEKVMENYESEEIQIRMFNTRGERFVF